MNIYNPVRVFLCSECNEEFSTDWTDEESAEAEREFKRLNAGVSWKTNKPSRIVCDPCHAKLARLWGLKASAREEAYQKARDYDCQQGFHLFRPEGPEPGICEWCGAVEAEGEDTAS